jgi:predicted nucleic acid-binding protein
VSLSTKIVLDSAAISSIFFSDPLSDQTEMAIAKYDELYTMDLACPEVGNVAWKRVSFFKEDRKQIFDALKLALEFIRDNCKVISSSEIAPEAFSLAVDNNITMYDALFLGLAKRLRTKVLTADEKLHRKLQQSKKMQSLVTLPPAKT